MGIIGIAANPRSGKDIRRLLTHASVFDNNEKTNIVKRMLLSIYKMGAGEVYMMPDGYNFFGRIKEEMENAPDPLPGGFLKLLPIEMTETADDTTAFIKKLREAGGSVAVVLGGDGTCRAAAKECGDMPLIPISTGTNNAYGVMCEGTVAGLAAGAIAKGCVAAEECGEHGKRIELYKNGELADIALMDAVFVEETFAGAKAVWDYENIKRVIVSTCSPASIGFSAILGGVATIKDNDAYGAYADVSMSDPNYMLPVAPGALEKLHVETPVMAAENEVFSNVMQNGGMIALDGERELRFSAGEDIKAAITRKAPRKVDVKKTLAAAAKNGFFKL